MGAPRAAMRLCAVVCTIAAGMVLRSTGGIVQDSKWPNKTAAPSKEEDTAVAVAAHDSRTTCPSGRLWHTNC